MKARIEIRQWLARKNNLPRIADVELVERTEKAVRAVGTAATERLVHCSICRRELTDPISQITGVGPICCEKYGIARYDGATDAELAEFKASLKQATQFDQWLPISQIDADVDLNDVPRKGRPEQEKDAGAGDLTSLEGRTGRFEVTQWIAKEKGYGNARAFHGKVKRATPKAILLNVDYFLMAIPEGRVDGNPNAPTWDEYARVEGIKIEELNGERVARYETQKHEIWLPTSQITGQLVRERKPRKPRPATPARKLQTDYQPEDVKVTANGHFGDEMPWD